MENISDKAVVWLTQLGISESLAMVFMRIVAILALLLAGFLLNRICRKILIPAIRKVTSKTAATWDDHLLGDEVLNGICRLISPVTIYALIFGFQR